VCRGAVKKMKRVGEPERKGTEFDVMKDTRKAARIKQSKYEAARIYQAPRNALLYAQPISGLTVIVALLFVPLITIPGMFIPVLVAEVFLLDWTYSKVGELHHARSSISYKSADRSPEDEIDKKVARTGPKDQFVR